MRDRPLLWSAAFFAAGILLPGPDLPLACWGACAATALAGALFLSLAASRRHTLAEAAFWVAIGFLCAGRFAGGSCLSREPYDIATLLSRHPERFDSGADLEGTLARDPRFTGRSSGGPHAVDEHPELDLLVDLHSVRLGALRMTARGRVRLRLPAGTAGWDRVARLGRGTRVGFFARLWAPRPYGNEGAFDYLRYLQARGIEAVGSIKSAMLVRAEEPPVLPTGERLMRRVDQLRGILLERIDRSFARDSAGRRAAAVAAALLLGERGGLTMEDERRMQESGLSHLLAVSGFNVAVLALSLIFLSRCAGLSSRGSALAVIPALCLYLLINRDESSVQRAVIMGVAALAARAIWRRPDALNTVGFSALAILVASPLQISDAGFQLTFAATLSLVVLVPRFMRASKRRGTVGSRAWWWVKSAAVITLAVWVGTFPITLLDFNRIAPGALPANLVAGPLMAAAFVGVLAIEAVAPLPDLPARALARVVQVLVEVTFRTSDAVRAVPILSYRRITPGPLTLLVYYGSLLAALLSRGEGRSKGLARLAAALVVAGSGIVMLAPLDTRARPEGLRVTAFDVGESDAILVETPSGARLLIDAGGLTRGDFDAGERVVSPALWRLGIARLDYLAVTHSDADHAGGAAAITANFGPREIWLPAGSAAWPPPLSILRLREAARGAGSALREMAAGDAVCLRGTCVAVLNPRRGSLEDLSDNDRSLVLAITSGGRVVLLAADAGTQAERGMTSGFPRADVLKVSHHGSATATSEEFARLVGPRVAVISCGARNRFGHPDRKVLDRLERNGARICRTDRHGAITIEMLCPPSRATRLSASCALDPQGPPLKHSR